VLKLTRRHRKPIVPTAKQIRARYEKICLAEIFSSLAVYRRAMLQFPPTRRDGSHTNNVKWTHKCFAEAIKKVDRIPCYRAHGIARFVAKIGITKAIKNEQIILCAIGPTSFITSMNGCLIDLTISPRFHIVLDELKTIISNIPQRIWKRVAKISRAYSYGDQIEYTSSLHNSLTDWMSDHSKYGEWFKLPAAVLLEHTAVLKNFEKHITQSISHFVRQSDRHVVHLQPAGALRTPINAVPQKAHRDFAQKTYNEQFSGQVYIGFMPVSHDGMFLQLWDSPGEAKLVFVPYGNFLLLPGNSVHAGWMCTSLLHQNY
jgi:hypothetical protein